MIIIIPHALASSAELRYKLFASYHVSETLCVLASARERYVPALL